MDYGMNAPAKEYDGVNKYIRITDIDEDSSEYNCASIVSPDGALFDKYLVNENDILFARTGSSTGKTYLYRPSDGRLYFAGFLIRANVKDDNDSNFIYHQCKLNRYWNWVRIMSARSGQPGINSQEYSTYAIYSTCKDEQIKISSLLKLLDERIATQRRLIEDLEKLKFAIIDKLLGHLRTYESDRMVKLKEIGNFIRGLTYSADDIVEDGGVVVVRANNLSHGKAVNLYNEIVRVDKPISDSQRLKGGDIVICMANGSSALVGKASYYNETTVPIATIGAFCGIYRSDRKIVRWLLQTNKYKHAVQKSLQGGNGAIANLSPNDILGLPFVIPKRETLIVELLQEFDEKLDIEMSLLHNLQKEKQYLLSQMFI